MNILIISDIHGNYPALLSMENFLTPQPIDIIINAGDSLVYAPFPNETLRWLRKNKAHSILGNTDKKVIKLLTGKNFKKPGKKDKRVMYTWTADTLTRKNRTYIQSLPTSRNITIPVGEKSKKDTLQIAIFHGSPAKDHEFLFSDTEDNRFLELSALTSAAIVIVGHSHTPFHKFIGNTHFINPGSLGRMFDGTPKSSFAMLTLTSTHIAVKHYRLDYSVDDVVDCHIKNKLPLLYCRMFREGKKLN